MTDPAAPTIPSLEAAAERIDLAHEGRAVCWRKFGSRQGNAGAPPLVLLHGGHGCWLHWVRNIEALREHRTVWVPDMPGFGDSAELACGPHAPERMQHLVAALQATLDQLVGQGTVIELVGFSFGGLVAAQLAAQRGAVRRLALLGPAGHGGARRQTQALLDWRVDDLEASFAALRQNLYAFMLHAAEPGDELALQVHERACRQTRFRSKAISRAGGLAQALGEFGGDVLLLWGEHDVTAHPADMAAQLTLGHPRRTARIVPGSGHWVQYERAEVVNHELLAWLAPADAAAEA